MPSRVAFRIFLRLSRLLQGVTPQKGEDPAHKKSCLARGVRPTPKIGEEDPVLGEDSANKKQSLIAVLSSMVN